MNHVQAAAAQAANLTRPAAPNAAPNALSEAVSSAAQQPSAAVYVQNQAQNQATQTAHNPAAQTQQIAKPAAAPQTQAAPSQAGADLLVKDKPVMKPVDISISGTPHRIICPSDEVKNLEATADHINQKLRDIRKNIRGKTPTNEELLVLLCLDLHDQVQQLKHEVKSHEDSSSQALALIDKITKDARSVLK